MRLTDAAKKRLDKLVAAFKQAECKTDTATIANNEDAIRMLAVWSACAKDWRPKGRQPTRKDERWRWMWLCLHFDLEELAALSGVSEAQTMRVLRQCMGVRVAYPNGEISEHARKLIEDHGRAKGPGTTRGRPRGAKDTKPRKSRRRHSDDE